MSEQQSWLLLSIWPWSRRLLWSQWWEAGRQQAVFFPLLPESHGAIHITLTPTAGNPWSSSHIWLPVKPFRRKWINSLQRCQRQLRAGWNLTRIPLYTCVQNPPARDQILGKAEITEIPGLAFCQALRQPSASCWEEMRCLLSSFY